MESAACKKVIRIEKMPQTVSRTFTRSTEVILVAVGFGARSLAALRWAGEFARSRGLRLRLVHSAMEQLPVESPFPPTASRQSWNRDSWLGSLHEALQDWAYREAKVRVPIEDICVEFSEPAVLILSEAARADVALVILGGLPSEATAEDERLAQTVLRHCRRPMLFVGLEGPPVVIVAATDCSDPALPVLRAARRMLGSLGEQLYLIHNVDPLASQFAARIGLPLNPALADCVAHRSREWLERTAGSSEVIITRASDNAEAVLDAAQTLGADLLVVGVKSEARAQHGTAERVFKEARNSVLFVPLPDGPAAM